MAHRDIKPENLIVENGREGFKVKLSYYGIAARVKQGGKLNEPIGTFAFMAPELFKGEFSEKSDI